MYPQGFNLDSKSATITAGTGRGYSHQNLEELMHPAKVDRSTVQTLTDLPNIGRACAQDLRTLGIVEPAQLANCCPFEMYDRLCLLTGIRHDPCMIDVFISITRFIAGEPAKAWWHYTQMRKVELARRTKRL
jgi:hypothetical protein